MAPFTKSTLLHARFPFSFFLLPIFLLALIAAGDIDPFRAWLVFFTLHLFIYPAANGFNSYYDRDEESIGALKSPPKVTPDLLRFSLALDTLGIILALKVGALFASGCLIYGLAAKAYSWDKTRIKKHPWLGWLFTGMGQGFLTFILVAIAVTPQSWRNSVHPRILFPAFCTGLFLLAYYPLTQVYQHREDARRGDITLSLKLGVRGTFLLSAFLLTLSSAAFLFFFSRYSGDRIALLFLLMMLPAAVYFVNWMADAMKDPAECSFDRANRMSVLMAAGFNLFAFTTLCLRHRA
jgi:4-hydroxybenzoate polyprenyltransferase